MEYFEPLILDPRDKRYRKKVRLAYLQTLGDLNDTRGGELELEFADGTILNFKSKNLMERVGRIIGALIGDLHSEPKAAAAGKKYGIRSIDDLKAKVKVRVKFRVE